MKTEKASTKRAARQKIAQEARASGLMIAKPGEYVVAGIRLHIETYNRFRAYCAAKDIEKQVAATNAIDAWLDQMEDSEFRTK